MRGLRLALQRTRLGVLQIGTEDAHATGRSAVQVDIQRAQISEYFAAPTGAGDQYIQSALPTIAVERPEIHGHLAVLIAAVPDADENHIAFITLHVLEILDEERFMLVRAKKFLAGIILHPHPLHLVVHRLHLFHAKRRHAKRQLRAFTCMAKHRLGHRARLKRIRAGGTAFVHGIWQIMILDTECRIGRIKVRKNEKVAVVKFPVGHGDQGFMPAAVMPAQHPLRRALTGHRAQNALQIGQTIVFIIQIIAAAAEGIEETRGRHLFTVAHHHQLFAAQNRAKRIHGLHLTGLIEDHQVKMHRTWRQKTGDRHRAHHEHRLDRLYGAPRARDEFSDRQMPHALFKLAQENPELTVAHHRRQPFPVPSRQPDAVEEKQQLVQFAEAQDILRVRGLIEPPQRFAGIQQLMQHALKPRIAVPMHQMLRRRLPFGRSFHHPAQPGFL